MTAPDETKTRLLRTKEEIVAAGAEAARGREVSDELADILAACIADAVPDPESAERGRRAAA